jgi:O-antigen biosynthesis protein
VLAGSGTEAMSIRDQSSAPVVCLGEVPDIDIVIAGADTCLAPLAAGAGVKTKVLDYLTHGKVVLATPVAMEGLDGAPGVHIAELDQFSACVLDHLSRFEEDDAARRRAETQRAWVHANYSAARVREQLRETLELAGIKLA